MAPSRQDDLDWLYGRQEGSPAPPPEPTRVLPASWPDSGTAEPPGSGPFGSDADPQATWTRQPAPSVPAARPPVGDNRAGPSPAPLPPGGPRAPGAPPGGLGSAGTVPVPGQPLRTGRRRRRLRTAAAVLLGLILLLVVALIGTPLYAWTRVDRVAYGPAGSRPADQPGTTFLLVGSDSREGLTRAERRQLGTGSAAGQRTDTIMLMHIPPSGRPALVSLPRDSYLPIPGHGSNKINAAFAFGGPRLLVSTIEDSTGLRVDGYMEIGFGGFVDVIDSLGGISMCLPKAIKDRDSHLNLKKGCQTLDGTDALGYVRMRKADPLGDLGRVRRQREMLAAVAAKAASPGTVLNPVRYWRLVTASAAAVTVGRDTSLLQTASLARAMKRVAGDDGLTLTVPVANADASTPAGSAVLWDADRARAMFAELARGDTTGLDKYAK